MKRLLTLSRQCFLLTLTTVFLCLFSSSVIAADEIIWNSGYPLAGDVNVGSSKSSNIVLRFEPQKAITNAKIIVTFPSQYDFYDPSQPATAQPSYPAITNSSWNQPSNQLTLEMGNLSQYQAVWCIIPHRAAAALTDPDGSPTIRISGDNIADADTSVRYNYNLATLQVRAPMTLPTGQSGLTLLFGDNFEIKNPAATFQEYRFEISCANASTDSIRAVLSIASENVQIENWKCSGITIPTGQISQQNVSGSTIYTISLKKENLPGGDGIDPGETVTVSGEVKKLSCGNNGVNLKANWGGTATAPRVTSSTASGSFSANTGGVPNLIGKATSANSSAKRFFDRTPNLWTTKIANKGTGTAYDVEFYINSSTVDVHPAFIDTSVIRCKVGMNGTWKKPVKYGDIAKCVNTSGYPNYKVINTNDINRIRIFVEQSLPVGDTLYIEWGSVSIPQPYTNDPGKSRITRRTVRVDDSWNYKGLCGDIYSVQSSSSASLTSILECTEFNTPINLKGGAVVREKKATVSFDAFANGVLWTNDNTSKFVLNIKLPQNVTLGGDSIEWCKFINESIKWNRSPITKTVSGTDTIYSTEFVRVKRGDSGSGWYKGNLYITYKAACVTPVNETVRADIWFDYYPTGTESGLQEGKTSNLNVKLPRAVQFYSTINAICDRDGLTYDFSLERKTIGLQDDSNTGAPQSTSPATTSLIDHYQLLPGDDGYMVFDGEILGSYNTLYAIVFAERPASSYQFFNTTPQVSGTYSNSDFTITPPSNLSPSLQNGYYPYVWKIAKISGTFTSGDNITLKIPFKVTETGSSVVPIGDYGFKSWFYAGTGDATDPLNPVSYRQGKEEYQFAVMQYKPHGTGWANNPTTRTYIGSESNQKASHTFLPARGFDAYFSPNEFRNAATIMSVTAKVTSGFVLADSIGFTMTYYAGSGQTAATTASTFYAYSTSSSDNEKTYTLGTDLFNTGIASDPAKLKLPDGYGSFVFYPEIRATNTLAEGDAYTCALTANVSSTNNTQANVTSLNGNKGFGSTKLVYKESGVRLNATGPITTSSTDLSWLVELKNTALNASEAPKAIYDVWLYVDGPVKDARFIVGTDTMKGKGEDSRWIYIPTMSASAIMSGKIEAALNDADCLDKTIRVYPIAKPSNTAAGQFIPVGSNFSNVTQLTDANFIANYNYKNSYLFKALELKFTHPEPSITGSFSSWNQITTDPTNPLALAYGIDSVEVGVPFPVEIIYDASGSDGLITDAYAAVSFPKGLKFDDSKPVNVEYFDKTSTIYTNTNISNSSTIFTALQTLTAVSASNPQNLTLALAGAGLPASTSVGINGNVLAGKIVKLHFWLEPTCDIKMNAEQITAKFYGKKPCDNSLAAGSGTQTYSSGKLFLKNALIPFISDLGFTMDKNALVCESLTDSAVMTLTFQKKNKLAEAIQITDSIKVALPLSLTLEGDIYYTFPAFGGLVSAETGTVPWSQIDSYIEDTIRYLAWQLPVSYYDKLYPTAKSDKVTLQYSWKVKTVKSGLQYEDSAKVYAATRTALAPHYLTCTPTIADADSVIKQVILMPAKIVTLPKGEGYVVTDKYGKEITAADTIIYNGEEFQFNVKLLYGYTQSVPTVKANAVELTAIGQGNYYSEYKFSVLEDTKITVYDVELNKYTVYFDTQGGSKVNSYTGVVHGTTIPVPSGRPVHAEYKFRGWYSCNDTAYIEPWAFDIARIVNDTTIYAFWVEVPIPIINRSVEIPFVDGVISDPDPGVYYVRSGEDYKFSLKFLMPYPLKVMTGRVVDDKDEEIFGTINADGRYEYVIRQVRSNILLVIGPDAASGNGTSNEEISDVSVWSHSGKLFVTLDKDDTIYVYSVTGMLVKKLESGPGTVDIPLGQGVYIVTLPKSKQIKKVLIQ